MNNKTILALDCETTGLNPDVDQIVEITMITLSTLNDLTPIEVTYKLRPTVRISPEAQKLHGLSAEILAKYPTFADCSEQFKIALDTAEVLVGYRIDFDIGILSGEFRRCGSSLPHWSDKIILDPYHNVRLQGGRRLIDIYKKLFGEIYMPQHSSLADARAVLRIAEYCSSKFSGNS